MTTYLHPAPRSAIERELAAPDRLTLTEPWFPGEHACERCGTVAEPVDGFTTIWSVECWVPPFEPGQFWTRRRLHICSDCASCPEWARERLVIARAIRRGILPRWRKS